MYFIFIPLYRSISVEPIGTINKGETRIIVPYLEHMS